MCGGSHQEEAWAAAVGQNSCIVHSVSRKRSQCSPGAAGTALSSSTVAFSLLEDGNSLAFLFWTHASRSLPHSKHLFLRGWLLHPMASWLTLATVPRHSKPGRMPPGWKCHKLLFAKGKEQFLHWPHCEMRNVFPAAARAQSGELTTFSLSPPNTFQSLHTKYFQIEKKNQEGVAWRFPSDTEIIAESKPPYSLGATGTTNYSPKIQLRFLSLFI